MLRETFTRISFNNLREWTNPNFQSFQLKANRHCIENLYQIAVSLITIKHIIRSYLFLSFCFHFFWHIMNVVVERPGVALHRHETKWPTPFTVMQILVVVVVIELNSNKSVWHVLNI